MPQKFGSNDTQLATTGGAVTADNGSTLISGDSQTESALLFGPASLREIQSGVANGDFAIMPNDPYGNITADNALPYWSVATTGSTCSAAIVADASQASGNALRVTVGAGSGGSITLTRYIPLPGTRAQTFSAQPIITLGGASNNIDAEFYASGQQYDSTLTSISGTIVTLNVYQFNSYTGTVKALLPDAENFAATWKNASVAANASFYKISLTFQNSGTTAANRTIDVYDIRLLLGSSDLTIAETTAPGTYGPAWIRQSNGSLIITPQAGLSLPNSKIRQYENIGGADSTTITTAGTYYALTSASNPSGFLDLDFTPQFVGQRWLFTFTGYASLNTAVAQYAFIRADVTTSAAVAIVTPWAYSRSENPGASGKGGTVAITKVWVADRTTACKFKLYGTTQTTNGLVLSTSYSALTAYPIG